MENMLISIALQDAFLLVGGQAGNFVWLGKVRLTMMLQYQCMIAGYTIKDSSKEEKMKAMSTAVAGANGWAKSTKVFRSLFLSFTFVLVQVVRVIEGIETAIFKQFFSHWNESENPCAGFGRSYAPGSIAEWSVEDLHFDNRKRIAKSAGSAIGYLKQKLCCENENALQIHAR